ncbi:hypothetical protein B0H13DRAFT_1880335 [Mycena leptocephala]|nr:hypothetical protein B0H13DRAFT_1880335 [Mycena leptocephala]
MQFKSSLLVLLTVASGTGIHASPTVTKTITSPISARSDASCKCLRALADEGVACAAAALADGCNLAADFSCALDLAIAVQFFHGGLSDGFKQRKIVAIHRELKFWTTRGICRDFLVVFGGKNSFLARNGLKNTRKVPRYIKAISTGGSPNEFLSALPTSNMTCFYLNLFAGSCPPFVAGRNKQSINSSDGASAAIIHLSVAYTVHIPAQPAWGGCQSSWSSSVLRIKTIAASRLRNMNLTVSAPQKHIYFDSVDGKTHPSSVQFRFLFLKDLFAVDPDGNFPLKMRIKFFGGANGCLGFFNIFVYLGFKRGLPLARAQPDLR